MHRAMTRMQQRRRASRWRPYRSTVVPCREEVRKTACQDRDDRERDREVRESTPGTFQLLLVAELGEQRLVGVKLWRSFRRGCHKASFGYVDRRLPQTGSRDLTEYLRASTGASYAMVNWSERDNSVGSHQQHLTTDPGVGGGVGVQAGFHQRIGDPDVGAALVHVGDGGGELFALTVLAACAPRPRRSAPVRAGRRARRPAAIASGRRVSVSTSAGLGFVPAHSSTSRSST